MMRRGGSVHVPFEAALRGRRILIVEDEMLVAMELEGLLEQHGCTVIGPAPSVRRALVLLDQVRPDAALLDLNLNGHLATPVAAALRAQDVPFVLVTGYSEAQARDADLKGAVRLDKPVNHRELLRVLAGLLDGSEPG